MELVAPANTLILRFRGDFRALSPESPYGCRVCAGLDGLHAVICWCGCVSMGAEPVRPRAMRLQGGDGKARGDREGACDRRRRMPEVQSHFEAAALCRARPIRSGQAGEVRPPGSTELVEPGQLAGDDRQLPGADDRAIIREKARALLRKGPGGCWRIVKGVWRFGARTSERPLPPSAWIRILEDAGFREVAAVKVVSEAWVVTGDVPTPSRG